MGVSLQQTSNGWMFLSEAALENFVWDNLHQLLGYTPIHRQYSCNGEVCDILALAQDRSLVILELKNVEDRYLIQQLTRYYDNLIEEKPFEKQIDYTLPIQLIGIAPSYHRHSRIDCKYSTLQFELLQFAVVGQQQNLSFQLTSLEGEEICSIAIDYEPPVTDTSLEASEPPDILLAWLSSCSRAEQEGILRLRSRLLSGSPRIQETVERNRIQYSSSKTRLCAEIIYQPSKQRPILFLWLPTPTSSLNSLGRKEVIGRLRIWTNGTGIAHVGHVAEGLGKMRTKEEWAELPKEKRPKSMSYSLSHKSHTPVEAEVYLKMRIGSDEAIAKQKTWDVFAEMTLAAWQLRTIN